MTTLFPGALDNFTNPSGTAMLGATTPKHSEHHANINDAIEAIETTIGETGSTDPASVEKRLVDVIDAAASAAAAISAHEVAGDPHPGYALESALGTAATLNVGTGALNIVQLDGSAKLPPVDGSQLTGVLGSGGVTGGNAHNHTGGAGAQIDYNNLANLPSLGTAAAAATGDFEPAGAISTHNALTAAHGISAFGATLVDDADAASARSTLGLGTAATTASTEYATSTQGSNADAHAAASAPHSGHSTPASVATLISTHNSDSGSHTSKANTASPALTGTVSVTGTSTGQISFQNTNGTFGYTATLGMGHPGAYDDAFLTVLNGVVQGYIDSTNGFTYLVKASYKDDLSIEASKSGSLGVEIYNTSISSSANAFLSLSSLTASSGDCYIGMNVATLGGQWVFGLDNSDNDKFKLNYGGTSPSNGTNFLIVDTSGSFTFSKENAPSAAIYDAVTFNQPAAGSGGTGLGVRVNLTAKSSTTEGRLQGALTSSWLVGTDATRSAEVSVDVADSTGLRKAFRAAADGTQVLLGFYGGNAVAKPTALTATVAAAPAGGTGTAAGGWDTAGNRDLAIATINNLKTRVDQLETKLQALGLLT